MSPTSDYVSFLLTHSHLTPNTLLALFFLGLFRLAPIIALAPFFGAKLPQSVKIGILLSLNIIFLPHLITTATETLNFNTHFILLSVKELFIGGALCFLISIPFYIAQSAGILIDFLRGSSSLMVTDPTMQNQASSIGLLYNYVLIVIFYQIQGPILFFDGLLESYSLIPADLFINPAFFSATHPFWQTIITLLNRVLALSIQFAAPSLVAILMAEMFLGIANRMAPQVQIAFLGMSLKSLLGIALLFAGWFVILQQMGTFTLSWLKEIRPLLTT